MTPPSPNPNAILEIIQFLFKPLTIIFNPLVVRWEHWTKRKPKLHIQFHPNHRLWAHGRNGDTPTMQLLIMANLSHDDPQETLVLMDVYLKGTKPVIEFMSKVEVKPKQVVLNHRIQAIVAPVLAEEGKDWRGKLVFVDQFERKWKKKVTLGAGGLEHVASTGR